MLSFLLLISDECDHSKIEYLYHTYHDDMMRLAKYRLRKAGIPSCDVDAEDAVQNAFVKITKYIASIDFDVSDRAMKSYVFAIVINEVINIVSDYNYYEDMNDHTQDIDDDDFFAALQIKERYEEVVNAIKNMDDKYSTTLLFYYCKNMSVKQIADLLGIPEKTVYTRLERGKRFLIEFSKG